MKKKLIAFLGIVLSLCLCACGASTASTADTSAGAEGKLETLGDAFAVESEFQSTAYTEDQYIYVFDLNGTPTRVVAALPDGVAEQIEAIDFSDEDYDAKLNALIGSLKLDQVEDLSKGIPSQEELDQLVGKTGKELLEDGYEIMGYMMDGESTVYTLEKGLYQYEFTFNELIEITDDFDEYKALSDLTVKSVEYDTLSTNCTDLSYTE